MMRHLLPLIAAVALGLSAGVAQADLGDQLFKLLPDDGAEADQFGWSVALSGTTAIVGARGDDDNGSISGSAYLFDISNPASPVQSAKLLPDDGAEGDWFGMSVAVSGASALVAAWRDDDNGTNSGSAYLFDTTKGQQIAKLLAKDGAAGDVFGISVAISGATAIVGAEWDNDNGANSGSAYLFDITTGQQIAKLLPDDGAANDLFGRSVAISAATAIVGAIHDDDSGSSSGSTYLFDAAVCPPDSDPDGLVTICHLPPGNPDNARTIRVSAKAVPAHLAHGDHCGACEEDDALLMSSGGDVGQDPCPTDMDESGDVDAGDLAELLGAWGPNLDHPADLDSDGNVGAFDLALLLGAWGPCP